MERNNVRSANPSTIVEVLQTRAQLQPDRPAYTFLVDGESEQLTVSYSELDQKARTIAAVLQDSGAQGSRALLLYPSGLDYIQAFIGCLYAGVVAVPAYPPRKNTSLDRIDSIVTNAEASHILCTTPILNDIERRFASHPHLQSMRRIATDQLDPSAQSNWTPARLSGDDLAFLQYTSGSTDAPKGVMVSHDNLLHNQRLMNQAFQLGESDLLLGWLPLYHDMGLIGNVLHSLYSGMHCVFMAPVMFLQKPIRWLRAVSHHRAAISGGPNFAYDLCLRKITPEQREGLDLSSWKLAVNGSEPIRAATLNQFSKVFEPYGFRRSSFFPCYGLAEATLFVSGGPRQQEPRIDAVEAEALSQNRVCQISNNSDESYTLVGSGQVWPGQDLQIIDPSTFQPCSAGEVGEIWIASDSVAGGYWKRPAETEIAFAGHIAGSNNGASLRTGDLGFVRNGELFVTGRLKDLIIIRGRNHYPQDIEATVSVAHEAVREGCCAAFGIDVQDEEQLAVVTEVKRTALRDLNADEVIAAIRKSVSEAHELHVHSVTLIKTGSLPKTTSGKIQRRKCKNDLLGERLLVVGQSATATHPDPTVHQEHDRLANLGDADEVALSSKGTTGGTSTTTRDDLLVLAPEVRGAACSSHLRTLLARSRKVSPSTISVDAPLNTLGLDSLDMVELKATIESDLQLEAPPFEDLQDASLNELGAQLADQLIAGAARNPRHGGDGTAAKDLFAKCDEDGGYFGKYRLAKDKYFTQPVLEGPIAPRMQFDGKEVIVWSINNYLGLAQHPHIHDRARQTIETHGTWAPMGSRLLTGNSERHMALEARLAKFLNRESSIVFNFGYMGVIGTINALVDESDTVIIDSLSHACIVDGALLASRGKQFRVFRHNDMDSLEDQLRAAQTTRRGGVLVVTEGLYGMTGDQAPLPEICDLKDRFDARLFIDDAHGFGIMGPTGAGTAEHQGVQDRVDLYFGTFAKSFAAIGGVTAGDERVVDYIRYNARPNIFAKSLPMVYVDAVDAALDVVEAEGGRRDQVWHIANRLQRGLIDLGFDLGNCSSPITPVYIPAGDEETAVQAMKLMRSSYGVFVSAVTYPVVPRGVVLFRLTATAAHTDEDVDRTLDAFSKLKSELNLKDAPKVSAE